MPTNVAPAPGPFIAASRSHFQSLSVTPAHHFFESAGGSQTLSSVSSAIQHYLTATNVQLSAQYPASIHSTSLFNAGQNAAARLLSTSPFNVVFGASATSLLYTLSTTVSFPRDAEFIISRIDHETNIAPWVRLAGEQGQKIVWWEPADRDHPVLTPESLKPLLNDKTALVAVTHSSNVLGVTNPVKAIAEAVRASAAKDAVVCVDGVAMTAHRKVEAEELGVDVYVFSWYKLFGPHISTMYVSRRIQHRVKSVAHYFNEKEGPGKMSISDKLGLAAASYELVASIPHVLDYLSTPGAWEQIAAWEEVLVDVLLTALEKLEKNGLVELYGERSRDKDIRVPVVVFNIKTKEGKEIPAETVVQRMGREGYGIRSGHCYAKRCVAEYLGLGERELVRVSFLHYNTVEEVQEFGKELTDIAEKGDWE